MTGLSAPPWRLLWYLVLPRPWDLLIKGLFLLVPLLLALATTPGTPPTPSDTVLCVVAFEVLCYQGRYAVNDLLGRAEDARHPYADRRRRLPSTATYMSAAAWTSVAVRAALAGLVACAVSAHLRRGLVLGMVLVVVLGIGYELLRWRLRSSPAADLCRESPCVLALWAWVGLGYSLRATEGYWIGGNGSVPWRALVLAMLTGSVLGSMHVTMSWALEARALVLAEGPATGSSGVLTSKRHLAPLLRHLPPDPDEPCRPLAGPGPSGSPWNTCLVLAALLAAVQGAQAALAIRGAVPSTALLPAVTATVCAVAIGHALPGPAALIGAVGVAVCIGWSSIAGAPRPAAAGVPLLGVFTVYLVLRRTRYDHLLR